jgi:hypothetical protein
MISNIDVINVPIVDILSYLIMRILSEIQKPFFYFSISLTERKNDTTQKLPFEVNTTFGLKNITASDSNVIQRKMFELRSVPVLWDVQLCF